MFDQARGRHVRFVGFFPKGEGATGDTLARLTELRVTFDHQSSIPKTLRRDVEKWSGSNERHATSAGLWAACAGLLAGARVVLCGFSTKAGYAYLRDVPPETRGHLADRHVIVSLIERYGAQVTTTAPDLVSLGVTAH
jgi:peptidoglycan/xylan/chitin deacetylase (PgdA/CDA1 family)